MNLNKYKFKKYTEKNASNPSAIYQNKIKYYLEKFLIGGGRVYGNLMFGIKNAIGMELGNENIVINNVKRYFKDEFGNELDGKLFIVAGGDMNHNMIVKRNGKNLPFETLMFHDMEYLSQNVDAERLNDFVKGYNLVPKLNHEFLKLKKSNQSKAAQAIQATQTTQSKIHLYSGQPFMTHISSFVTTNIFRNIRGKIYCELDVGGMGNTVIVRRDDIDEPILMHWVSPGTQESIDQKNKAVIGYRQL
jgi:hypothetical protein